MEKIASQKNVLEAVLRAIPMKRRFAKNYLIMRNLVFNPRTPIDLSLGLMKNILVGGSQEPGWEQRVFLKPFASWHCECTSRKSTRKIEGHSQHWFLKMQLAG